MAAPILSARVRNRALLHRQLLLDRSTLSIPAALHQLGALQTQYAPAGYVGLWSRLRSFERTGLTSALESGAAVQATMMRTTIHTVARADYWPFAAAVRMARRRWALRVAALPPEDVVAEKAARLAAALAAGPRYVKELDGLADGFIGSVGLWVDLVRVPPSGTWERRRADRLGLAELWVGPDEATEEEGLTRLVRAGLRGFGPLRWSDLAGWAGIPVADAKRGGSNLELRRFVDDGGRELVDLADAMLPDADTAAPVRFLAQFDNSLLVHFRATGILPEAHRSRIFNVRNPFSVGTVLVDGRVAATWVVRDGRIVVEELEPLEGHQREAIEAERAALEAFHR
ncbi:MAG TPA: winged helix DNA-binding domain-containing protein [Candidatus Limnocylindrales bacterium]|nr:winged helix DNA-binding domain-containing protein [Candidatus Limnocylindrales bacterium]